MNANEILEKLIPSRTSLDMETYFLLVDAANGIAPEGPITLDVETAFLLEDALKMSKEGL